MESGVLVCVKSAAASDFAHAPRVRGRYFFVDMSLRGKDRAGPEGGPVGAVKGAASAL